jgi:hypothetical protein
MRKPSRPFSKWIKLHKRAARIALASVIVVSFVGLVLANQSSTSIKVSWTVLPFQELRISGSTSQGPSVTTGYTMPQPDFLDLQRGYIEEMNSIELTINSNIAWKVQVWTENTTMGDSHDGLIRKPVSDFELREHGGTYFPISNTPQILADGQCGSFEIGVDHRILLEDEYHDGDYGLEVVYTIMPR